MAPKVQNKIKNNQNKRNNKNKKQENNKRPKQQTPINNTFNQI